MLLKKERFFQEEFPVACAKHQRSLTDAIKRARNIALLPFTTD